MLAVKNLVVQNDKGDLITGATIKVERDVQGTPLAAIYSDRAGTQLMDNPFISASGKVRFFAAGGAYKITITKGAYEDVKRYEPIGRGAETDISNFVPRGEWSDAVEYNMGDVVVHLGSAGLIAFVSLQNENTNHEPDADTPDTDSWWMVYPGVTSAQAEAILDAATTQAGIATTQAGIATTQAGNALTQANNAAASALSAAAASVSPAFRYTFNTTTNATGIATPQMRGNNATLASWTTIFFHDSAVQGNIAGLLNSVFNHTNPTRGHIIGINPQNETKWFIFAVTGYTDQTNYTQFAGSIVASSGPFTNGMTFVVNFVRAGNQGAGDLTSTNNLSDVASKIAAFDNLSVQGANIASAATLNLGAATGDLVDVTGTTTITAITLAQGKVRTVRFTGALTLTNGANLVLPGGANITTAAGDFAIFRGYASGVVRCVGYFRANGRAVDSGLVADVENQGPVTGGATVTPKNLGTISSGTVTVDVGDRPMQSYTNNGAHTLASSGTGSTVLRITNSSSAGAITLTAFSTRVYGDPFDTTNGSVFRCVIEDWTGSAPELFVQKLV